eukprot:2577711-Pleurochrysis_carterae.AAC.2
MTLSLSRTGGGPPSRASPQRNNRDTENIKYGGRRSRNRRIVTVGAALQQALAHQIHEDIVLSSPTVHIRIVDAIRRNAVTSQESGESIRTREGSGK